MDILSKLYSVYLLVIYQFKLIFPYWIGGVIAGSILSVFFAEKIKQGISRMRNKKYSIVLGFAAAFLGVASPICMYGTIPLIASLGRKGVPQYLLATFMVSSVLLNPNLFFLSFVLGTPIALLRLLSCIVAGLLAGILVKVFYKNKDLFCFDGFEEKKKRGVGQPAWKRFLGDLNRSITITAPYFLLGILLTALFDRFIPKEIIVKLFTWNEGLGVLFAASLGVPVYVCGGGTIPLLRVWMQVGMSAGSAMAFMISGPATKLTNLGAVKVILGAKNFMIYILFNILFAVAAGFATDLILGWMG